MSLDSQGFWFWQGENLWWLVEHSVQRLLTNWAAGVSSSGLRAAETQSAGIRIGFYQKRR